jgi:hypothetical protein
MTNRENGIFFTRVLKMKKSKFSSTASIPYMLQYGNKFIWKKHILKKIHI